ncbi:hypothetical protein [Almyronema epifaneia]|uniref:Uncharacterized protein n=1 Tax=Almyronema epifaneia S1 TaxID=2991925 RepID=A0ABW6IGW5_9CYAN
MWAQKSPEATASGVSQPEIKNDWELIDKLEIKAWADAAGAIWSVMHHAQC